MILMSTAAQGSSARVIVIAIIFCLAVMIYLYLSRKKNKHKLTSNSKIKISPVFLSFPKEEQKELSDEQMIDYLKEQKKLGRLSDAEYEEKVLHIINR